MPYPSPHEKKQARKNMLVTMVLFTLILVYAFAVGALVYILASM